MNIMVVHPHEGIDRLRFGMDRAAVALAVGMTPQRFRRGPDDIEEDFFRDLGMSVGYDEQGSCNFVGASRGFGVDWDYEGYRLFSHPALAVREWAMSRDPDLDPKDGFTSKALGLAMYCDWLRSPDLSAEDLREVASQFSIFRPGYYEEEAARFAAQEAARLAAAD